VTAAPRLDLVRERVRQALPVPPRELRALVGPTDPAEFDNPDGSLVYPHLDEAAYKNVFDFGCGCGRVARQLLLQEPRPGRYVGIDLHRGMVDWARQNLQPEAPGFEFLHHDVFNHSLNPGPEKPLVLPFPVEDRAFSLVNAWSVFTHLTEEQAPFYLHEVERALATDGVFQSTWFLFEKAGFPMMGDGTNALYITHVDPTAAVLYDRSWVLARLAELGLIVVQAFPPSVRGFQWLLVIRRRESGAEEIELPVDDAPFGSIVAPPMPEHAASLGP
jgi:SAM-dependent methyltransferase